MSNINKRAVRRTAAGVLASTLAFSGMAAGIVPANAAENFQLVRVSGNDRFETSANIAAEFGAATSVILASGEAGRTADALAANFLAGVRNAPVLLTRRDTTPEPILERLRALRTAGATRLTIIGGEAAVSRTQLGTLQGLGFTVDRLEGANRYETSQRVVAAGTVAGSGASRVGLVASGTSTIDALAGGPLSFKGKHPMFLTARDTVPAATLAAMRASGVTSVYVLGGEARISERVLTQIRNAGITIVERLAGVDRAATSVAIANEMITEFGFSRNTFNLASGANEGVDALGGAALSGKENRVLLITNSASNAGAVTAFAQANRATLNTAGRIFGGTTVLTTAVETAVEQAAGSTVGTPATVTVPTTAVTAGENAAITVSGTDVASVAVSGNCINGQTFSTDADANAAGFQFSLPTQANAAAGSCEVTFVITFTGGRAAETVRQTITIAAPTSATTRPELVSARILGTVQAEEVTGSNPIGTRVSYTFDENLNGDLAAGDAAVGFLLYDVDGASVGGAGTVLSAGGNTVTVRFGDVATRTAAATVTVATVDRAAVIDAQGQANPEGDAAVGTTAGPGTVALPAGVTDAPDLVSVGNFREAAGTNQTAVDFTFDQAATVLTTTGFELVLVDGAGAANDNVLVGSGPGAGSTTVGGGTVAGGNGTNRITVVFANPVIPATGPGDVPQAPQITAAQVARGTVVAGTVESGAMTETAPAGVDNVLQAADVSAGGNSDEPDLVSVSLRLGTDAAPADRALFTFDQPVGTEDIDETRFALYDADGNVVAGVATTAAVVNAADRREVLVTFTATAGDDAVGGTVADGAVATAPVAATGTTAAVPALQNEQDEVGFANSITTPGRTAGRTAGPDLTGVALSRVTDPDFGNVGDFRAVYTFDEDVQAVDAADFRLIAANGAVLQATACAVTAPTGTQVANDVDNTVTCTAFATTATPPVTATSAQVGAATLGTVDGGAVTEEGGTATNPEGAEFTTGGTGTRSAE